MQIFFILVLSMFMIVFFLRKLWENSIVEHHAPVIEKSHIGYKKKFSLMTKSESALFFEIKKQLPFNYYVFPNMRMADIVDAINGYGFYKRRNKILPKHIDFVICNSNFKPLVAIELNGASHNNLNQIEKDDEKKRILAEANLPLVIINVGENFTASVEKLQDYFN